MLPYATLQLDSYYFTLVDVRFDRAALSEDVAPVTADRLESKFSIHEMDQDEDGVDGLIVDLEISSGEQKGGNKSMGIEFTIRLMGRFILDDELKERIKDGTTKQEMVISNALSILYGSIRDQLFSITAKMPIGSVYLPTCRFPVERADADEEEKESGSESGE